MAGIKVGQNRHGLADDRLGIAGIKPDMRVTIFGIVIFMVVIMTVIRAPDTTPSCC